MLRVAVTAPSPLLKGGLAFIDTPGVGGHGQPHLSATLGLLPDADAMLMISDTSQEFTEPEMTFIRQAFEICPVAVIVATKTDLYPHWREIVDANAAHLQRAELSIPMIPVSSMLRSHAIQLNDKELNEESNFPAIVKFLSDKVLSRENDRVRDQVLAEIRSAAEHLTLAADSELSALNDPEARDRLTADLERRKQEAQDALQQTALWQQVLNDGIADLTADVDHDLRGRFRAITQHTEHVIDERRPDAALGRDRRRTGGRGGHRGRRQLRLGLPACRGAGPRGGADVRRGGAGSGQRCRRSTPATWAPTSASSNRWPSWRPSQSRQGTRSSPACAARTAAC